MPDEEAPATPAAVPAQSPRSTPGSASPATRSRRRLEEAAAEAARKKALEPYEANGVALVAVCDIKHVPDMARELEIRDPLKDGKHVIAGYEKNGKMLAEHCRPFNPNGKPPQFSTQTVPKKEWCTWLLEARKEDGTKEPLSKKEQAEANKKTRGEKRAGKAAEKGISNTDCLMRITDCLLPS